jgi:hypothetical protein
LLIFAIQMVWIPFSAAGVINGMEHYWGHRNDPVEDATGPSIPSSLRPGALRPSRLISCRHAFLTLTFDLRTVYSMRQELSALWSRSRASRSADQLLDQLCDWRARAESSGVAALRAFARRLPHLI